MTVFPICSRAAAMTVATVSGSHRCLMGPRAMATEAARDSQVPFTRRSMTPSYRASVQREPSSGASPAPVSPPVAEIRHSPVRVDESEGVDLAPGSGPLQAGAPHEDHLLEGLPNERAPELSVD